MSVNVPRRGWLVIAVLLLATAVLVIGFVCPMYFGRADRENDYLCVQHLVKIRFAIEAYWQAHGSLPKTLEELVRSSLVGEDEIFCPNDHIKYTYLAGDEHLASQETVIRPLVVCYQHYETGHDIWLRYKRTPFVLLSNGNILANFSLVKMNVDELKVSPYREIVGHLMETEEHGK